MRHMLNEFNIPIISQDQYDKRLKHLSRLEEITNSGEYAPQAPVGWLTSPKRLGVCRHIPVLHWEDTCVYYACVRSIDEELARLAIPGTYGGWTLGGQRPKLEDDWAIEEAKQVAETVEKKQKEVTQTVQGEIGDATRSMDDLPSSSEASISRGTFNPWAWLINWKHYSSLTEYLSLSAEDHTRFLMFDIANFYDSIDLPRLMRLLRSACPEAETSIGILSFFLSHWNRKNNSYHPSTKGLPMDLIGDCSRVLANAFLTPADKSIRDLANCQNGKYLRYADDMIVTLPADSKPQDVMANICGIFHEIGLQVNSSKVRILSKNEFREYWGFDVLQALETPGKLHDGLNLLQAKYDRPQFGRRHTVLKRAITHLSKEPRGKFPDGKRWVYELFDRDDDNVVAYLSGWQIRNVSFFTDDPVEGFAKIGNKILNLPYTESHLSLLKACDELGESKALDLVSLSKKVRRSAKKRLKEEFPKVR